MEWYQLNPSETLERTGSSAIGLSSPEASARLREYGPNELEVKKRVPAWLLFLNQFRDFMIIGLILAALISGLISELSDALIILAIVLLNAVLGFTQEYRSQKAMEALKKLAIPRTRVRRDGILKVLDSSQLVPGDQVELEAGDMVPADLRLFEAHSLKIDETSLTGESFPVDKDPDPIGDPEVPLGDRKNLAFRGTLITNGRGSGIVVETGMRTEFGRIALLLQEKELLTPLQVRMRDFGKKLLYIIGIICAILFGVGILRGEQPLDMFLLAISLAVAAIPEGLPALITLALAQGARKMARKNALIRKLPAIETLGSVSYICTDKTGTLTQNNMQVEKVLTYPLSRFPAGLVPFLELAMSLNQDLRHDPDGSWNGDPTEMALAAYIAKTLGPDSLADLRTAYPRVAELPFDANRKCMTTIHSYGPIFLAITKGAPETLGSLSDDPLTGTRIQEDARNLSAAGFRVLAFAYRLLDRLPEPLLPDLVESGLIPGGLAALADPPRPEAFEAVQQCRQAGIRVVMITGDHPETAAAIGRRLGILAQDGLVVTGRELGRWTPDELDQRVEKIRVYARVSPEQKLIIVKSLQRRNQFVAMTGDGVNDAPSLRRANMGIAMGITGTDMSKEAADMILLDDNFATIVQAVKEGRRIYENIRKFIFYMMTCNGAEIWTLFLAPLLGLPIPLLAVQILWINLVTDGLPGLSLAGEPAEPDIMKRPPRPASEGLFSEGIGYRILWMGLLMAASTLGLQAWAIHTGDTHWQTMVFSVLALVQLGHALAISSQDELIYRKGLGSNPALIAALVGTFFLQLGVIYLPLAHRIFHTQSLSLKELLITLGVSALVFHAAEADKYFRNRRKIRSMPLPG